ncbi:thiamine pyrophosphate-dependent dehydrogenase E1 component subunit alpha, partial [Butyricicoccus sp. 1XD8-22]
MEEVRLHHSELGLKDEDVLQMYETMLMARRIDERMWLLNRSG